ncbi:unnamed protein product, partial [Prorocentrum cordatum]
RISRSLPPPHSSSRSLPPPPSLWPGGEEQMHASDHVATGVAKPLAGTLASTARESELAGSRGRAANPLLDPLAPASARGTLVTASARGGAGSRGGQWLPPSAAAPPALSAREARSGGAPPAPAVPGAASSSARSRPRA